MIKMPKFSLGFLAGKRRSQQEIDHRDDVATFNFERLLLVFGSAAIATPITIAMSYEGIMLSQARDGGDLFRTEIGALMAAIGVGALQAIGWAILLNPQLYRGALRSCGGFLWACAFVCFGLGASSFFNFSNLAFASSMAIYTSAEKAERVALVEAFQEEAAATAILLPKVEAEVQASCEASEAEVDRGVFSGSAGRGRIAGVLSSICARARVEAEYLERVVSENKARATRTDAILRALEDKLADVETEPLQRERELRKMLRDLDAVIRDYKKAGVASSVTAFFESMVASVSEIADPNGQGLAGRQNLALAELRSGFEQRVPIMERLVKDIASIERPVITMPERPAIQDILWFSVHKHISLVMVSVFVDVFGFVFTGVLLIRVPAKFFFREAPQEPSQPSQPSQPAKLKIKSTPQDRETADYVLRNARELLKIKA